ncbi:MAG: LamG domain-containing protein [Prevotellaceae bacterium]|jgi:hypothetical protein|nr:LamG domain-containing protein [Prevotellaceae bacterium]
MKLKTFLFAAFVAAFLSGANYAAAQVTMGGGDPPKAGTILDLNSTTKGGLLLSNVALTDLNTIPVGFPGINSSGDVNDDVKAKLTGAIVYNIDPKFCLGVYVWNGNKWLKVDKDYQVKAAKVATLDIPAITDYYKDFVPENKALTFKVETPGDAQFYHWYADNTYLTTTTAPEYTTSPFLLGSHTMKVVLDNCLSLSEPNTVPFTIRVSPATIKVNTSEYIRIYGNNIFTYAPTSDYEQNGLVAHYDGINNEGNGDENHNFTATTWTDLSGKENHLTKSNSEGSFDAAGFTIKSKNNYWIKAHPVASIPTGNSSFTAEMRYKIAGAFPNNMTGGLCTVSWGYGSNNQASCIGFEVSSSFSHAFFGNDIDWSYPGAYSTPNTLSVTYTAGTGTTHQATARKAYANANVLSVTSGNYGANPAIPTGYPLIIGNSPYGVTVTAYGDNTNLHLQSVRIYNKVLEKEKIDANFAVDEKRFIKLPTVTVGGQSCTDVAILSPHILTCKAPQIAATGEVVVTVTGDGVSSTLNLNHGELKYVP